MGLVSGCAAEAPPTTVKAVADRAVAAARSLDVEAGARLLCTVPSQQEVSTLKEDYLDPVSKALDGRVPSVSYEISEVVDNGGAGSFVVTMSTSEPELAGSAARLTITVESRDGRSCINPTDWGRAPGDHSSFRVER